MNANDKLKMKMLDDLESAMDDYDKRSYVDKKKNQNMASVSEAKDKPEKKVTAETVNKKEKVFYTNPDREKLLRETESLSVDNDPILMRGQFSKRKK